MTPAIALGASDAPAATCQPAARLEGAEALVAPIGRVLRARGVSAAGLPVESCRQVAVQVRPAGTGFHLVILDAEGRTSRRQLPSAESAALVIESWSRGDLAAELPAPAAPTGLPEPDTTTPLTAVISSAPPEPVAEASLAPSAAPVPPPPPPARAPAPPPTATLAAHASPAPARPARLSFALAGESSLAFNRSSWWGASAAACLRTGPLCSGLTGRYGRALAAATTELAPMLAHHEAELGLATRFAVALGPLVLAPSLGVGASRAFGTLAGARLEDTASPAATRSAREGGRDGRGPDRRNNDTGGSRAREGDGAEAAPTVVNSFAGAPSSFREDGVLGQAGLSLALPLAPALAVELGASFGYALFRFGPPSEMPRERLRAGLGLRYGGR